MTSPGASMESTRLAPARETGEELKPCPFCGVDAGALQTGPGIGCTRHSVFCFDCSGEGPVAYTRKRAIELWNTRASLPTSSEALSATTDLKESK